MAIHDYNEKLEESQDKELQKQLNTIYEGFFPDKSVVRMDYLDKEEFQRSGRDLRVVLHKPGKNLFEIVFFETIEEKIRSPKRSHYKDILIEYLSNVAWGTLGWIYTSKADWLSYVKQPNGYLEVLILSMPDLKAWFLVNRSKYEDRASQTLLSNGKTYTTMNKVVPVEDELFRNFIRAHGFYYKKIEL